MAGDVGFDPLGLSNIDDVSIDLYWLHEADLKHVPTAMLATAGFLQLELFGPAPGCEAATAKNQMDAFWQIWNSHPQYIAFGLIMITITEFIVDEGVFWVLVFRSSFAVVLASQDSCYKRIYAFIFS